ncbi:MAG: hypothetical protein ABMB14_06880 [Myxococcota bacterium]
MQNETGSTRRDAIDTARDAAARVLPVEPERIDAMADQARQLDRRVRDLVKAYPTSTVLGAVAIGFLAGRMLRRW